jgi:hypothetical protein
MTIVGAPFGAATPTTAAPLDSEQSGANAVIAWAQAVSLGPLKQSKTSPHPVETEG